MLTLKVKRGEERVFMPKSKFYHLYRGSYFGGENRNAEKPIDRETDKLNFLRHTRSEWDSTLDAL